MKYDLLCSGSKGNCFVLRDEDAQIIIDCGSTRRYLLDAFKKIGVSYENSDALLITHEHSDHTSQLKMFSGVESYSPYPLPYVLSNTVIQPNETFSVRHLSIKAIALSHDAPRTVGYIISNGIEKLVYITDTGYLNSRYYEDIRNADYYIMESNHDVEMLMRTNRPYLLKQRILSDSGHLSNDACAEILSTVVGERTKEVVLAHLSEEANEPSLAYETTRARLDERISVRCGSQKEIVSGGKDA